MYISAITFQYVFLILTCRVYTERGKRVRGSDLTYENNASRGYI